MEGVFFSEPVGRRVPFRDPGRTGVVDLDVDEVRVLKQTAGQVTVILRARTDYFTYTRIRDQEWFRLTRDSIDPDIEGFQFWSHAPIEVELHLDRLPEALAGTTPGELADRVASGLSADLPEPALCDASAYRYLTVLQDLEGNGVRKGFQAVWTRL